MVEPYNVDDAIREYIEENDDGDGVTQSELIDAVCPRPKNHASYALVIMRIQSLYRKADLYRPSGETRYRMTDHSDGGFR